MIGELLLGYVIFSYFYVAGALLAEEKEAKRRGYSYTFQNKFVTLINFVFSPITFPIYLGYFSCAKISGSKRYWKKEVEK